MNEFGSLPSEKVTNKPLVSLCMATCLRADLFPDSFRSLLNQTYEPLEIVVLADGSNEHSLNLLKNCNDPRVRWISTPSPSGMVPAWNLVCRESRGKYFLFCADDDVLLGQAIDRQVELMETNENVVFCHADFTFIDDDGREINRWVSHEGTWVKSGLAEWPRYLVRTGCCMQTTVARRSAWDEVKGWDEDAGNPGDNSLYLKLLRIGDVGHVEHLACQYRIRTKQPDSWVKKFRDIREYYQLTAKHLASPPILSESLPRLRQRLLRRLSSMAVPLLISAPDHKSKQELRNWLQLHVCSQSGYARFCQYLDHVNCLRMFEAALQFEFRIRGIGRQFLKPAMKILRGSST